MATLCGVCGSECPRGLGAHPQCEEQLRRYQEAGYSDEESREYTREQFSSGQEAYLVTDYGRANIKDRVGDRLAGDEVITHGFLKAHGVTEKRRLRFNAALLLPEGQHKLLSRHQRRAGLHDPLHLAELGISQLLEKNAECMAAAGLSPKTIDRVQEYAMEQVPALLALGVPY